MQVALLLWLAEQATLAIVADFTSLGRYIPTAFSAHIGGFLTGLALGFVFLKAGFVRRYVRKWPRDWLFGYLPPLLHEDASKTVPKAAETK